MSDAPKPEPVEIAWVRRLDHPGQLEEPGPGPGSVEPVGAPGEVASGAVSAAPEGDVVDA